ncbi:MAG: 16S rRNA (guanine(966)-N(2))-methyltransferase RsmD [Candidatus Pelagibacter sp.]|nr:16S rRNA (guanine(966)-N(2))-methyltransferase RsmD [Candidatus Pelagibacter sp.]OUW23323.1 MAG: 16S rRNA (guanine(966)-N(2))-methyltransferase RsmD [Rickettsiales bacterium TMED174]|tara:strand:+ start:487 stop:1044 length:558 start_codon:yes stop_codon:yes gene_type:complete
MRIVSGELKGKKIHHVKSNLTRPLKDQVKESIFNIINHSNLFQIKIKHSEILDLYSGTGSFGIECLSRGAKQVNFVEQNNIPFNILKNNLRETNLQNKSLCSNMNVSEFLKINKKKFDIIFFDPPFKNLDYLEEIKQIKEFLLYKKNNLIIIHREKRSDEHYPNFFKILKESFYGRSKILFGTIF